MLFSGPTPAGQTTGTRIRSLAARQDTPIPVVRIIRFSAWMPADSIRRAAEMHSSDRQQATRILHRTETPFLVSKQDEIIRLPEIPFSEGARALRTPRAN